ncbi:hypothetical protein PR048_023652 [Dryococelus australis]|uniref:Uncharacterized protein n=1 Tax=Dryococelus australis TaxID=614101 RepID=A0ABQ9GUS6_9NEOP|nr:hypothetical protein PR048_023652 [Dryococelus australis]
MMEFLTSKQAQPLTRPIPEDRNMNVVINNLPSDMQIEEIKEELEHLGYQVLNNADDAKSMRTMATTVAGSSPVSSVPENTGQTSAQYHDQPHRHVRTEERPILAAAKIAPLAYNMNNDKPNRPPKPKPGFTLNPAEFQELKLPKKSAWQMHQQPNAAADGHQSTSGTQYSQKLRGPSSSQSRQPQLE